MPLGLKAGLVMVRHAGVEQAGFPRPHGGGQGWLVGGYDSGVPSGGRAGLFAPTMGKSLCATGARIVTFDTKLIVEGARV